MECATWGQTLSLGLLYKKISSFQRERLTSSKRKSLSANCVQTLVPLTGVEPVRNFFREILSLLCLPIPP